MYVQQLAKAADTYDEGPGFESHGQLCPQLGLVSTAWHGVDKQL